MNRVYVMKKMERTEIMKKTMMKNLTAVIVTLLFLLTGGVVAADHPKLDLRVNPVEGSYDLYDVKCGEPIVKGAKIGFEVAPYIELADVASDAFETQVGAKPYWSTEGSCRLGDDGTMIFRKEGVGELEVEFVLPPKAGHLEIGFSFRNLGEKPVRLRKVTVADGTFLPKQDRVSMLLLGGNSGGGQTKVLRTNRLTTENNMLCFFADRKAPRSLVAGGLTYAHFRKYVVVDQQRISLFADDPVGKRVDPGFRYDSADRFYLDGLTDNPFEALEQYALVTEKARGINLQYYTMPSTCMWFISVYLFGGDKVAENSSVGIVTEMQRIADSGFLKYSPVAVRLVPDNYEQNNEQGWWDNEHWQMHGRKERCIVDHHYKAPYETTEKWAKKVQEQGGVPLIYFQPGIRSEDYAKAFPGHMLYNQSQKLVLRNGKPRLYPHGLMGGKYKKLYATSYDYTDPGFLAHWRGVNRNLKRGGVQGVFYDYPKDAFGEHGGFENRYATATEAYRTVYRVAREELGAEAYLQERLGPGSDATLEFVNSVRTEMDNNSLRPAALEKSAMRWYKNRRLTNYDMDGKALLTTGHRRKQSLSPVQRRAVLTMSYTATGRLLLTESFRLFDTDVLHDLSRVFPFHATPLSARPLDAFSFLEHKIGDNEIELRANVNLLLRRKTTPADASAKAHVIGEWSIVEGPKKGSVTFNADGKWISLWPDWHGNWELDENDFLNMMPKGSNKHPIRILTSPSSVIKTQPKSKLLYSTPCPPCVYDFGISEDWHQLVLYGKKQFSVPLSGNTAFGSLGLAPESSYYVYDFWNDAYVGKLRGNSLLNQELNPNEARMLSIHAVQENPQWISTDRHLMQGYVDMVKKPEWNAAENTLTGTSSVIGGQPYRITLALNEYTPKKVTASGAAADITIRPDNKNLADLILKAKENQDVPWKIAFSKGLIVEE